MSGRHTWAALCAVIITALTGFLAGCSRGNGDVPVVELVQYKPETANYFKEVERAFNETHDDVKLVIQSPNDASTILKTRFIREDYPDIIGIGGDINYSYYVDALILQDVSDYPGLKRIKKAYLDINELLEIVPVEGMFGVPYMANAAGVLYNRDIFKAHGWKIPQDWNELTALCKSMKDAGVTPFALGLKDTWTCLAPWNAIAVDLAPAATPKMVNRGETTFTKEYNEAAEKFLQVIDWGTPNPIAYSYNDACTSFAHGEAAMFPIGSYAVPQILSVNPNMNIDSFTMPAGAKGTNSLNSGIDLQFCITKGCRNKEAAYKVLDFLFADENIQKYIDNQNAVPCREGNWRLPSMLDGMREYIDGGNMKDYQDHYYPSEMSVDAILQTYTINRDKDVFLARFDKDWKRYNRDIIRKATAYAKKEANK